MRKIFTLMLSLLALCLQVAAQTAQPDVTLTFPNISGANESTALTDKTFKSTYKDASAFIGSISTITKVYATTAKGMKLGASGSAGTLKISLTPDYQRDIEKITLVGQLYNSGKAATVTINGVSSTGNLSGSESEISFTGFTSNVNGSSLTIESSKYVCIRSISIYFKSDKQPVEQPVITCSDNKVAISCGTEGASIVYSTDGSDPSIPYTEPFSITETCTVKAKASKEGMADNTAEMVCEYVAPAEKPSKPVVMVDGTETAEEDIKADYGAKVTVSSENATSLVVEYGSEKMSVEGNAYEFEATANETYMVTPFNNMMPEGEQEGEAAMFAIAINAPEILSVMNGEEAIEEFGSIVAREGTEIAVSAKSYADIAVDNDGVTVTVTDGKFVIGNEGSYIITVSNPACEEKAEMMFEVTHPEEIVYEVNETLNWEFTKIVTPSTKDELCNSALENTADSSVGIWTVASEKNCYSSNTNGIQLGSGKSTFLNGTLTLSGSEIPENATITTVSLKGLAANGETFAWGVSVNGETATNTMSFKGEIGQYGVENHIIKSADNINLEGNEIVITLNSITTEQKAFYLSGISVSYYVLAEPSAPEFDKPATIEHGTEIVYTVKYGKIHYHIEDADAAKNPMARASEPTADWTVATEDGGKKFTYTFASGNNHNIYVKNVVNGKEVMGEAINVKEGVVTGVESVAAEGAEGVRELYNLQGVRVSEAEAVPGVYVERRGGKVAKVVIR